MHFKKESALSSWNGITHKRNDMSFCFKILHIYDPISLLL